LLGIKNGAAAILGFLAGVSPIMHDFWRMEDPNQRMNDMVNFTKNLALMGGAAALMAVEEPWPLSVPVAQPRRIERARKFFRREIAA
jgi:putative oxidoreductase